MTDVADASARPVKADEHPASPANDALIEGVNVDAVTRAVQACAGVSALSGGRFGEVASYLPGRRVPGVTVGSDVVQVHVRARWGVPADDLLAQMSSVLTGIVDRRIEVVVAEIDDPPTLTDTAPTALAADQPAPSSPAPALLTAAAS